MNLVQATGRSGVGAVPHTPNVAKRRALQSVWTGRAAIANATGRTSAARMSASARPPPVARSLAQLYMEQIGDPGAIRTRDPQIRNLMLYPAELRGPVGSFSTQARTREARRPGPAW